MSRTIPRFVPKRDAQGSCGTRVDCGGSPDGWTAPRARCRRRAGPPCGGADRAGCSAAYPARRADSAGGVAGHARRVLARLGRGRCPKDRLRVRLRWCRERMAAGTRNAAAARCRGWRRVACVGGSRRSSQMAGCTTGMGARTGRWPARRRGTGPPRRLLVVRLRLETARPAAQSADPGQGGSGESFAA